MAVKGPPTMQVGRELQESKRQSRRKNPSAAHELGNRGQIFISTDRPWASTGALRT